MRHQTRIFTILLATMFLSAVAHADERSGFGLDVVVGGDMRPEYFHDGTTYVEAIRGSDYTLRITNPTPYRVAVALSVDGLNTIDAKHTDARNAAKWVLGPYESAVIPGWQVSDSTARHFVFTGERHSYGAYLGKSENLGVIEAVFFQERRPIPMYEPEYDRPYGPDANKSEGGSARGESAAPKPSAAMRGQQPALSDEYAATGMGYGTDHNVDRVQIDLEPNPVAKIRIRYEFRPQLVKLGILPSYPTPLQRRERARGFDGYCPEPN